MIHHRHEINRGILRCSGNEGRTPWLRVTERWRCSLCTALRRSQSSNEAVELRHSERNVTCCDTVEPDTPVVTVALTASHISLSVTLL